MNLEAVRKHQKAFSILVIILIVLFVVGMFFIQQALNTSQDLRQQASTPQGQVEVTMLPIQPGQVTLNQPSYIDLGINTNNLQTNGVQLTFEVTSTNVSSFSFEPISGSGFGNPLINAAVTGNAGEVAFFPSDITAPFSSVTAVPFIRINFTPTSAQNVKISFNNQNSQSTIYNSNPPQDELRTVAALDIPVTDPTVASPSPSPSPSPVQVPSPTPSPSPIIVIPPPSPTPSPLPTPSPSPVPTPVPTPIPSPSPSPTPSPTASTSPSPTATATPIASASPSPSPEASPQVCANNPDLNDDARVDLADYSQLAANFMQTGENLVGDIDCSGSVDLTDYSILSQNFTL